MRKLQLQNEAKIENLTLKKRQNLSASCGVLVDFRENLLEIYATKFVIAKIIEKILVFSKYFAKLCVRQEQMRELVLKKLLL